MTRKINLLVTSGLPYTGKTEIAKYLRNFGFARINTDDLREMFFGRSFTELDDIEEGLIKDYTVWGRDISLVRGFHTVIDSCAVDNRIRGEYLGLHNDLINYLEEINLEVVKYLLLFYVKRDLLIGRGVKDRKITPEEANRRITILEERWQEPSVDATVLEYWNNTREELAVIKRDLEERLNVTRI